MSSTYVKPASGPVVARRSPRRSGLLGLGAVLAGVTAVGAAVAIFLVPAEAPITAPAIPLPAMDASLGYWDHVDDRPAVSSYAPSQGAWDHRDPRPARPAVSRSESSQGYWDHVDARSSAPSYDPGLGYWDHGAHVDARPALPLSAGSSVDITQGYVDVTGGRIAVAQLPAMPASMGHWDFTLPTPEPTIPGF